MEYSFEKYLKQTPVKSEHEVWENFARFPFFRQNPEQGFEYVFSVLKEIRSTPCQYLYLLNEAGNKLILEKSDLGELEGWAKHHKFADELIQTLRRPELSIPCRDEHRQLTAVKEWGIDLINIPLYLQNGEFIGVILSGLVGKFRVNSKQKIQFESFSIAAGAAIKCIKEIEALRDEINALASRTEVSRRMLASVLEVNKFVDLLLDLALTATKAEAGFVAIADNKVRTMTIRAHKNLPEDFLAKIDLTADGGLFQWPTESRDILILQDYDFVAEFNVKSILAVPLIEQDELIGVFALLSLQSKDMFTDYSLSILKSFVEQIKLILHNSKLFEDFTRRYMETLVAMSTAYDQRSKFTVGHSRRVARVAGEIAREMNLSPHRIKDIEDAGLIHDVGMCGVVEIREGYQADYNHTEVGASMIEMLPIPQEIVDGVKTHHEWYDGWGFPHGLKNEQIPLSGKIIAVAEFYVEITANNRVKNAATWEELLNELKIRYKSQFDPEVVDALVVVLSRKNQRAKTKQLEPCWEFKGTPEDVCSHCPAYKNETAFCWSNPGVLCEKHGDSDCNQCFIFNEWLYRIGRLISEHKIEVKTMEHTISQKDDVIILKLKGEIDVSVAPELRNILKKEIDANHTKIIVDLADVDFIDSSGLGILVVAFKAAKAKGGNIKFANAKPEVLKVIELTRLDKHFELFSSVEQAEESF